MEHREIAIHQTAAFFNILYKYRPNGPALIESPNNCLENVAYKVKKMLLLVYMNVEECCPK